MIQYRWSFRLILQGLEIEMMTTSALEKHILKFLIGWILGFLISAELLPSQLSVTTFTYLTLISCITFAFSFEWLTNTIFLWLIKLTKSPKFSSSKKFLSWLWNVSSSNFWSDSIKEKFWILWKQSAEYNIKLIKNCPRYWYKVLEYEHQEAKVVAPQPVIELTQPAVVTPEQLELNLPFEIPQTEQEVSGSILPQPETSFIPELQLRSTVEEAIKQEIYNRALSNYREKTKKKETEDQPEKITKPQPEETEREIQDILPPLPISEFTRDKEPVNIDDEIKETEEVLSMSAETIPSSIDQESGVEETPVVELSSVLQSEIESTYQDETPTPIEVTKEKEKYHPEIPILTDVDYKKTSKSVSRSAFFEKTIGIVLLFFLKFIKSFFNLRFVIKKFIATASIWIMKWINILLINLKNGIKYVQESFSLLKETDYKRLLVKKKRVKLKLPTNYQIGILFNWFRDNLNSLVVGGIVISLIGLIALTTISFIELRKEPPPLPITVNTPPEATKAPPKIVQGQRIVVDIGEQESLAAAMKKLEKMKQAGFSDARIYLTFDRKVYIHVGNCETKQEAKELGWKLVNQNFTKTFTYLSATGVELK